MNDKLKTNSKVFIIPNLISHENVDFINKPYFLEPLNKIKILFVENLKNARQFLKLIDKNIAIDHYQWVKIEDIKNKHTHINNNESELLSAIKQNINIGLMSDSGYPNIADPGNKIIALAHQYELDIIPLIGPNSILLALVCSGMNGQHFTFHGYLPIKEMEKIEKIKTIETQSKQHHYTHIFIETPYRNQALLNTLIQTCKLDTNLCVAIGIHSKNQKIINKKIADWKKLKFEIEKIPTVFLIN